MDFDNSCIDGFSCAMVEKSTVFQPVFPVGDQKPLAHRGRARGAIN